MAPSCIPRLDAPSSDRFAATFSPPGRRGSRHLRRAPSPLGERTRAKGADEGAFAPLFQMKEMVRRAGGGERNLRGGRAA